MLVLVENLIVVAIKKMFIFNFLNLQTAMFLDFSF